MHDYRAYLKAIGRKPVDLAGLRTEKRPGTVEIIRHLQLGHVLHRYGEHPLPKEGQRYKQWRRDRAAYRLLED